MLVTETVRWLLLPLLVVFIAHAFLQGGGSANILINLAFNVGALLLAFGLFLSLAGRWANGAMRSSAAHHHAVDERELIHNRLTTGEPAPFAADLTAAIGVFVSGHTHAPSLTHFDGPSGVRGALVNSGRWLRQLQPVPARFGAPPVFVSRFVQTHVRVYLDNGDIHVELWEHPRPSPLRMRVAERFAVLGRRPADPDGAASRVRAGTSVGRRRTRTGSA